MDKFIIMNNTMIKKTGIQITILAMMLFAIAGGTGMSITYDPVSPTTADGVHFTIDTGNTHPIAHIWDFGDGEHSIGGNNTYHRYRENTVYRVTVTLIDNKSQVWQINRTIFIENDCPVADFTWNIPRPNPMDNIIFTDKSTDSDGHIMWRGWRIDNGTLYEEKTLSHVFIENGEYMVNLTIMDDDGGTSTIEKTVKVMDNKPPYAVFTMNRDTAHRGEAIHFADTSHDTDGTVTERRWDFGDGESSNGKEVSHSYRKDGEYKAILTVWDDDNGSSSFSKDITVLDGENNNAPGFPSIMPVSAFLLPLLIKNRRDKEKKGR